MHKNRIGYLERELSKDKLEHTKLVCAFLFHFAFFTLFGP